MNFTPFLALRWWAAVLIVLCWLPLHGAQAQSPPSDSAVKAAFLYKFGSFVDWPAQAFRGADDPLVIGVLGDDAVAADLEQLVSGRLIGNRSVRVRTFREQEPVAGGVHVLLVGPVRPGKLRELVAAVAGPVLVVTQQEGALAAGSVINFVTDGARVRFSVSLAAAEARGLRLSARLLTVAQAVEGRR
jgi:YfiR/HmsC-like